MKSGHTAQETQSNKKPYGEGVGQPLGLPSNTNNTMGQVVTIEPGSNNELEKQLFDAIRIKDIDRAKELIGSGVNVNFIVNFEHDDIEGDDPYAEGESLYYKGDTLLIVAARRQCPEIVKALIDKGADVNAVCNDRTALFYAASFDNMEIAQALIEAGVDVNLGSDNPLQEADTDKMKALLREHGAEDNWSEYDYSSYVGGNFTIGGLSLNANNFALMAEAGNDIQGLKSQVASLESTVRQQQSQLNWHYNTIQQQQSQLNWQSNIIQEQQSQINWLIQTVSNLIGNAPAPIGTEEAVTSLGETTGNTEAGDTA